MCEGQRERRMAAAEAVLHCLHDLAAYPAIRSSYHSGSNRPALHWRHLHLRFRAARAEVDGDCLDEPHGTNPSPPGHCWTRHGSTSVVAPS